MIEELEKEIGEAKKEILKYQQGTFLDEVKVREIGKLQKSIDIKRNEIDILKRDFKMG